MVCRWPWTGSVHGSVKVLAFSTQQSLIFFFLQIVVFDSISTHHQVYLYDVYKNVFAFCPKFLLSPQVNDFIFSGVVPIPNYEFIL